MGIHVLSVDAGRFSAARAALVRLLNAGVADLSEVTSDLRGDGLPVDWVPDIATLTAEQRMDLLGVMEGYSHPWCNAMRDEII